MDLKRQYDLWYKALKGDPIIWAKDQPPSGFWRQGTAKGQEFIAVWRDENGVIHAKRNVYGDGRKLEGGLEIGEELSGCFRYPVPHELYQDVTKNGKPIPPEYCTRLTLDEIKRGICWTPELGRLKLGVVVEQTADANRAGHTGINENGLPQNPRAIPGDNKPPEELPADKKLAKLIHDCGVQFGKWLEGIGGAPKTQAEAEVLGQYANKFKDYENEAVAKHKAEKEPFLKAGRDVDGKWFGPVRDKAIASRNKILDLIRAFQKAEDARRAEEARIANEAARKAAEEQTKHEDAPPAPVQEVVPEKTRVSTLRGGGTREPQKLVTDLAAFLAYCAKLDSPPPDIVEAAEKVARKWKSTGVQAPGMERNTA